MRGEAMADQPVTAVVRRRIKAGCEASFESLMREFMTSVLASLDISASTSFDPRQILGSTRCSIGLRPKKTADDLRRRLNIATG